MELTLRKLQDNLRKGCVSVHLKTPRNEGGDGARGGPAELREQSITLDSPRHPIPRPETQKKSSRASGCYLPRLPPPSRIRIWYAAATIVRIYVARGSSAAAFNGVSLSHSAVPWRDVRPNSPATAHIATSDNSSRHRSVHAWRA